MTTWSLGEWMVVVAFVMFLLLGAVAWVVSRWSDKWGNRLAGLALLVMLLGVVNGAMLWNEPLVPR
jgi:hypothetical protein